MPKAVKKKSAVKKKVPTPTKKVTKKSVKKRPLNGRHDPDRGEAKHVADTKTFSAGIVQIEYRPGAKGFTDVHIYLDQGKSKIVLTGIYQLSLDGVWVVTRS